MITTLLMPVPNSTDIYNTSPAHWERCFLIAWSIITALISLPGNTLILVASLKYNAIKLDRVSVILIRNLAVADLVYAGTVIAPTVSTLLAEEWVYGQVLCSVQFVATWTAHVGGIVLVCALNVSKLTCLLFPLRAIARRKCIGRLISAVIWGAVFLVCIPAIYWAVRGWVGFSASSYRCDGSYELTSGKWWLPVLSVLFGLVPIVVVTVTTLWLMFYVKRVRGLQKRGVVTLVLVSVVFMVAHTPYVLLFLSYAVLEPGDPRYATFYEHYYRFSLFIVFINYVANPFIYFVSIESFKEFVMTYIFRRESTRSSSLGKWSSSMTSRSRSVNSRVGALKKEAHVSIRINCSAGVGEHSLELK